MKLIIVAWRDPAQNLREETFVAEKFKVHTEPGWLKLYSNEEGGIVRLIPSDKICLVQYVTKKDEPRILRPEIVPQSKFQES